MKIIFHLITICLLLTACTTTPTVVDLPVRLGMSKDELRHTYGPPLRTVTNADGSEDWFYRVGSRSNDSHSFTETSSSFQERSTTYGVVLSTFVTYTEAALQLSPAGFVIGIPPGKVVR